MMKNLMKTICVLIDRMNYFFGKIACVCILLSVCISAFNALIRKAFNISSNGFLEAQWYLFAMVFLLGAGYTYLNNRHVRIDLVQNLLSPQKRAIIEILGVILFLWPAVSIIFWVSLPMVTESWRIWEMSSNPGGLPRAPIKLMIPIGLLLLALQGLSQAIKCALFIAGAHPDPLSHHSE